MPTGTAHASVNYGHSCCVALLRFFFHATINLSNYGWIQYSRKECCTFRTSSSHLPFCLPKFE